MQDKCGYLQYIHQQLNLRQWLIEQSLVYYRNLKADKIQTKEFQMDFFNQYRNLFQVGNAAFIPTQRLRLDNDLFIDRPYISTYKQQHSLNSKLRQLKKDYNQFDSQLRQLQQMQSIPKRSQSRRKQPQKNTQQGSSNTLDNKSRHIHSHKKNQSNIFNLYQQNKSQYFPEQIKKKQSNLGSPLNQQMNLGSKKDYLQSYGQNQKQNRQRSFGDLDYSQETQQLSPEKQQLQHLRRQNNQNTSRLIRNQNLLKNKFYQEDTNNVLKQSQMNHIFNWKLEKPSAFDKLQYLPESNIPKYKIQNTSLQARDVNQNRNFSLRDKSNNQVKLNNRNKILPQQKQHNSISKNSTAMQRRKIAKQNIDQRREKLKAIIKSFY